MLGQASASCCHTVLGYIGWTSPAIGCSNMMWSMRRWLLLLSCGHRAHQGAAFLLQSCFSGATWRQGAVRLWQVQW